MSSEQPADENGVCSYPECSQALDDNVIQDAGSGKRYCSREHLFADVNSDTDDASGPKADTLPSELGASVTVVIPTFECPHCQNDSERLAREDSEWVHHPCGMAVPEAYRETANRLLEDGEFDRGVVKQAARAAAQRLEPQLDAANLDGDHDA